MLSCRTHWCCWNIPRSILAARGAVQIGAPPSAEGEGNVPPRGRHATNQSLHAAVGGCQRRAYPLSARARSL